MLKAASLLCPPFVLSRAALSTSLHGKEEKGSAAKRPENRGGLERLMYGPVLASASRVTYSAADAAADQGSHLVPV